MKLTANFDPATTSNNPRAYTATRPITVTTDSATAQVLRLSVEEALHLRATLDTALRVAATKSLTVTATRTSSETVLTTVAEDGSGLSIEEALLVAVGMHTAIDGERTSAVLAAAGDTLLLVSKVLHLDGVVSVNLTKGDGCIPAVHVTVAAGVPTRLDNEIEQLLTNYPSVRITTGYSAN